MTKREKIQQAIEVLGTVIKGSEILIYNGLVWWNNVFLGKPKDASHFLIKKYEERLVDSMAKKEGDNVHTDN